MVEVDMRYEGKLHCTLKHGPSGSVITTDAPRDNMGLGEAFSPTDLVAAALGSCILTTMGIMAQRMEIDMSGATAHVTKEMTASGPRKIRELAVTIRVPGLLTDEQRQKLQNAAMTCPVHKSLHPDVSAPVRFEWA